MWNDGLLMILFFSLIALWFCFILIFCHIPICFMKVLICAIDWQIWEVWWFSLNFSAFQLIFALTLTTNLLQNGTDFGKKNKTWTFRNKSLCFFYLRYSRKIWKICHNVRNGGFKCGKNGSSSKNIQHSDNCNGTKSTSIKTILLVFNPNLLYFSGHGNNNFVVEKVLRGWRHFYKN